MAHGFGPAIAYRAYRTAPVTALGWRYMRVPIWFAGDTHSPGCRMCFSNEPMIVRPGKFGIRLEDHFWTTAGRAGSRRHNTV